MPKIPAEALLARLDTVLEQRRSSDPSESYVASLHDKGLNKILEKVGEEATETIIAAKELEQAHGVADPEDWELRKQELVGEVADLWFHSLVLLSHQGLQSSDIVECLADRFGLSGHDEKAARG